ncbi:hypothetical protein [Streptomyces buecherae]|uniref:Uncharacterized protein n=1 Tax=Streptomyces buecherae TaxID=2763006 RepID=A0A7H8N6E0_9ACTN|nr:hypothetical protein [Streptomyces buecherae]QKW49929.1 hypothetical protein HUT08_10665 [Streptomyces buecherae]
MVATDGPQDVVSSWKISAADLPAAALDFPASVRVYLLPDTSVDGVAVYRDDAAGIVKTLRHRDVDIDFAVPREGRRYFSEFSAAVAVTTVCVAVASTLTADLIKNIALTTTGMFVPYRSCMTERACLPDSPRHGVVPCVERASRPRPPLLRVPSPMS